MRRIHVLGALLMTVLLPLAACGSDDDGGVINDVTPTTADTGAGSPTTGDTDVTVKDFAFAPTQVSVRAGGKVTWRFADSAPHTVTADDKSFDSGRKGSGETFDHTFATAGSFTYHCTIHPTMAGTVTVSG